MAPHQPCRGCKYAGNCVQAGLVNRLAVDEWLAERGFECADHVPDFYHGVEGVFT